MDKNGNQLSSSNFSYQQEVLDKFNDRFNEIELFFELIAKFEHVNPTQLISVDNTIDLINQHDLLVNSDSSVEVTVRAILRKLRVETPDVDLINIFKSNSILLLYNLVESTVSNTDRFILKTISSANLLYSQSTPAIKEFWLKHNSKFNKNEYLTTAISLLDRVQTVKIDVIKQYNDNEKEFQGSLDPKTVDEILIRYGIETTKCTMLMQEDKRKAVRNIAMWRNDLAHGKYSFAEFGRELRYNDITQRYKEQDILFIKNACFSFLEIFLLNVEKFIEQELYKNT